MTSTADNDLVSHWKAIALRYRQRLGQVQDNLNCERAAAHVEYQTAKYWRGEAERLAANAKEIAEHHGRLMLTMSQILAAEADWYQEFAERTATEGGLLGER